jgi:GGDEF domain-containing protein
MSLLEARSLLGAPADPLPLLREWGRRAMSLGNRTRYRWTISTWPPRDAPAHLPPRESWSPWRPRDVGALAEDRAARPLNDRGVAFEERLITPLVIAEAIQWLTDLAESPGEAGHLARAFLAECRATARRDAAAYAQERHAWGDTWALWTMSRHPAALRLLHPFALAIAEAYADTTIAAGREAVHETRFPFAGVPLVSASAQLATGCLALGVHPKLTGRLTDWIKGQQRGDGGFGDGDGPSDVLTTLVAARLLAALDPGWDPRPAAGYLASVQDAHGLWRAYGPEIAWLTLEIYRYLELAARPFAERFDWPEAALTSRDRRTGVPRYDYYADLARLCLEVSGLGTVPIEVAFLDLAGFGVFNNRHGMAMGDAVLREFAQALAAKPELMTIRDGGDEFLALGTPGGEGLAASLDAFRREWPTRLRSRFGAEARVMPRILVASTSGRELVRTRDELGRQIAALKLADPIDGLPPEGVLVNIGRAMSADGGGSH